MIEVIHMTLQLGAIALAAAVALAFIRVVIGPTLPDRVLALDLVTVAGVGLMAIAGIAFDTAVFLDIALVLVVAGFVSTAAFAQIVEKRARDRRERGGRP